MKTFTVIMATFLCLPVAPAQQQEGQWTLALFGGIGMPAGTFADAYNTGFSFGGEVGYGLAAQTTLGIRATYHRFAVNDQGARNMFFSPHGGTITSFSFEGGEQSQFVATLNLAQQITPADSRTSFAVMAGSGLYLISTSDITTRYTFTSPTGSGSGTSTTTFKGSSPYFGLNGGLGLTQWVSTDVGILVEGRYHVIFSENESTSDMTLLAGVRILLGGEE